MKRILIIFTAIVLSACSNTDDSIPEEFDATVIADINGETKIYNFGPNSIGAVLNSNTAGGLIFYTFGLAASTDGVSDNSETETISIALISNNPDLIMQGGTYNSDDYDLFGFYSFENADSSVVIDTNTTIEANLSITTMDTSNETISGEFSFIAYDEDANLTFNITNGTFSNLPYWINID